VFLVHFELSVAKESDI